MACVVAKHVNGGCVWFGVLWMGRAFFWGGLGVNDKSAGWTSQGLDVGRSGWTNRGALLEGGGVK